MYHVVCSSDDSENLLRLSLEFIMKIVGFYVCKNRMFNFRSQESQNTGSVWRESGCEGMIGSLTEDEAVGHNAD